MTRLPVICDFAQIFQGAPTIDPRAGSSQGGRLRCCHLLAPARRRRIRGTATAGILVVAPVVLGHTTQDGLSANLHYRRTLPTIRDGVEFGDLANLRSEVRVGPEIRRKLTFRYDSALSRMVKVMSCGFFDIFIGVVNRTTQTASEHFRNRGPLEHHLDKTKTAGMLALSCTHFPQRGIA